MSRHRAGAANAESGFGEGASISRSQSMNSQTGSEEGINFPQVTRTQSLNSFDLYPHGRPIARVASTSSIESNTLGRRRREPTRIEEPPYTIGRGSRSDSNLVAPGEAVRQSDELSDTESLDGRRVRAKYISDIRERRPSSWRNAPLAHAELAWRNGTAALRAISSTRNLDGNAESVIDTSAVSRDSFEEAQRKCIREARHFSGRSAHSGDTVVPGEISSPPNPPRKNSETWGQLRNREGSNSSNRGHASPSLDASYRALSQAHDELSNSRMSIRDTNGLSPSPGRIRAASRSSGSYAGLSSRRERTGSQSTLVQSQQSPTELVLPRWQPDAEVTFCPICRTQFSKKLS